MPNFLNNDQALVLRQAHRTIRDKKVADRIKAILSLNAGEQYAQVARILLLDEITLRRYVKQFQKQGLDGLLECRYTGGQTRLTVTQEQELKVFLKINTHRTAASVVSLIRSKYGVTFSTVGVTKLLHRLGFSYKKPKIVPGKADLAKQAQFLEVYRKMQGDLGINDQIYFADSTHPEHNTKPSYGWILKGKVNDKFVKTNTGRERLNLNGALSLKDKTAVVLEEETINSGSVIRLFKKLAVKQPMGKIHLILDNASYHHSKLVKEWLKKHRRFKLHFLPPYSPNLNLIERLWRFFHLKVTWNRYFATFDEFRRETLKFFKHLSRYGPELNTLLADNFQVIPALNLQT
jgi:transposase